MKPLMIAVILMLSFVSVTSLAQVTPGSSVTSVVVEMPTVPGEPKTAGEVIDAAKQGFEAAKAKNWFGFSSIAILVLVWILKTAGLFKKIAKRWIYIIVPALGVIAMLLAAFVGGLSFGTAWTVLASAPCAALLSDFVKRGILNQEYETQMKPGG
jgi:hypothetical protein